MEKFKKDDEIKKLAKCISEIPSGTLKDIADKAGISKATLYRKYGTREGLVESIKEHVFKVLDEIMKLAGKEFNCFSEGIEALVHAHLDSYEFFCYLSAFQETFEWECWENYCKAVDKFFFYWQNKGEVKLKFSSQFLTEMFFSSLCGLFDGMTYGRIASKGMAETFQEFFINGVKC